MSDEELTLSVSQYIDVVNNVLKSTMGEGVWVQGEIEGFNNRTKHTYFNVVERSDGKKASVNVAIWEFNLKRLKPLLEKHRLTLADGIKVRLLALATCMPNAGRSVSRCPTLTHDSHLAIWLASATKLCRS